MTNLEYMKQSIFNQINAMTAEDFYSYLECLRVTIAKIHTVHVLIRVIFA